MVDDKNAQKPYKVRLFPKFIIVLNHDFNLKRRRTPTFPLFLIKECSKIGNKLQHVHLVLIVCRKILKVER